MERRMELEPGYDCRVECQHEIKSNHGINSDIWVYVVIEGNYAVSLDVFSKDYPATVDRNKIPRILRKPSAGSLGVHRANEEVGRPCDYVPGKKCQAEFTYVGAAEFWEKYGDKTQREQPETFWKALEARLLEEMGN